MSVIVTMFVSQATGGGGMGPYLVWVGMMIVVVIIATGVLMAYRRRILSPGDDASVTSGRLLEGLTAMRDRGEISVEEFEVARASMVARLSGARAREGGSGSGIRPGSEASKVSRQGFDLTGDPLPGSGDGFGDGE